ncbi:hypothetical protein MK786_01095 [Microbacterium sp. CFH 31415]|uniref:helix-turn-helix domain-containing protein n=1 Tax=Microbacterium sp. CFH 31415 TaxID=2921732 RepID=UPI001F12E939|nr:helix-turn-helix domain-containing protein [Microbacterium sp. CFH 31415]MCH6229335.1 hypothetical protein [Microbacterium sp. CFH 31415]
MALPRRRQPLAKFIPFHDLTPEVVAAALNTNVARIHNLCRGLTYPSPDELAAIGRLFGLPVEVFFEPEMLVYRDGPWPPPRGGAAQIADFERLRAQLDRDRHEAGE